MKQNRESAGGGDVIAKRQMKTKRVQSPKEETRCQK